MAALERSIGVPLGRSSYRTVLSEYLGYLNQGLTIRAGHSIFSTTWTLLARGVAIKRVGVLLERFLPALRLHFELLHGRLEAARQIIDEGDLVRPILEAIKRRDTELVPARFASYTKTLCNGLLKKDKAVTSERGVVLSEREHDVVRELSVGHSNKLIARKLGLAAPTVKFHVQNLFRKLGVRKRAAAVAEAHRRGWLT